ncbi:galectin-12 [Ascaphus truei]|uniref:galectin-12 n=1 Tax=Ascaphus truei TaxID=8439 RepID=UPI003F5943BA
MNELQLSLHRKTTLRFQVDLQTGCSTRPCSDVAFHFNPRFSASSSHVICNALCRDQWLEEVRVSEASLHRGESFLLLFLFQQDMVKVSVGGHHFMDFSYRIPLSEVDTLGVYGDISLREVSFLCSNPYNEERTEYPVCQPLNVGSAGLVMPHSRTLPQGTV